LKKLRGIEVQKVRPMVREQQVRVDVLRTKLPRSKMYASTAATLLFTPD